MFDCGFVEKGEIIIMTSNLSIGECFENKFKKLLREQQKTSYFPISDVEKIR